MNKAFTSGVYLAGLICLCNKAWHLRQESMSKGYVALIGINEL
jgi:hypothetical protein